MSYSELKKSQMFFLGNMIPQKYAAEVLENTIGRVCDAADVLQKKLISGIETASGKKLTVINQMPVDSYPRSYKKMVIHSSRFSHDESGEENDINCGFLNLQYVKYLFINRAFSSRVKKAITKSGSNQKIVFGYSMSMPVLASLRAIKKKEPGAVTCLVIPDMPEFVNFNDQQSFLRKLFTKYIVKYTNKALKYVDCYVLLTKHMAGYLKINKPYVVMEGISPGSAAERIHGDRDTFNITYTGSLCRQFGIIDLLDAFAKMDDARCRLVICGAGDAEGEIASRAKSDSRIVFMGQVSYAEATLAQRTADILVNPRTNNGEYTKYSFPSKTMEYLSTGVPTVAYKLDGIPNEYDAYLNYVEEDGVQGLYDALKRVENDPLATQRAEDGRRFVLENKQCVPQAEKICGLVNEVINKYGK